MVHRSLTMVLFSMGVTNYRIGSHRTASNHIGRTVSNSQYNSIAPSKRGFVIHWGLSQRFGQSLRGTKSCSLTSYTVYKTFSTMWRQCMVLVYYWYTGSALPVQTSPV